MGKTLIIPALRCNHEMRLFDGYCRERGYKRSSLIARLDREHLERERFPRQRAYFPQSGVAMDQGA